MRVLLADDTKSYVLMRDSRGGFASGEKEVVTDGGGFAHSESMLAGSSVPTIFESEREVFMSEGAWISE